MKKKQLNKSKIKQNQEKEWEWGFLTNTNSKKFSSSETHFKTLCHTLYMYQVGDWIIFTKKLI